MNTKTPVAIETLIFAHNRETVRVPPPEPITEVRRLVNDIRRLAADIESYGASELDAAKAGELADRIRGITSGCAKCGREDCMHVEAVGR